jgi:queuine tRNA-ribosyltransferase
MSLLDCEVVVTRNGATALRDRVSGEVMHPMGHATEAQEVYVGPARLEERLREGGEPLVLLDVGLGAASNAICAWRLSESLPASARRLQIVSFEHDLNALELARTPAHVEAFGLAPVGSDAYVAASAIVTHGRHETPRTSWRLNFGDALRAFEGEPDASADVVFWDMFSTGAHLNEWTVSAFRAVRRLCRANATLHTYRAATSARSAMLLGGFAVGIGPPSGEQGQTTIGAVNWEDLTEPLGARWLQRLLRSTAPFPPDVASDEQARAEAMRTIQARPQFQRAAHPG